jgi:LDH2 family malate/lactate/ureidoglycolate dehydrogenase
MKSLKKQLEGLQMTETRPYAAKELTNNLVVDVFKAHGFTEADAIICADVLLESDRRGVASHGCNRFKAVTEAALATGVACIQITGG